MIRSMVGVLAGAALTLGAVSGCETHHTTSAAGGNASIAVVTSAREALVGDTVTFTVRTKDTYGRDANVHWTTNAASLKTEQDGRIARVKFDEPGTYTVRATLQVDNADVSTDAVDIKVRPVN